jgi:DNA helicase II / ATP-dependent DNA helicase PcrA
MKWQDRLHYIQVDEYQDSNGKQYEIIEKLSRIHKNLFVVGDPDQTIYEWRGADIKFIVDFDEWFSDTKTIIMNQNYRSTPEILSLSNDLITRNKRRVSKEMITTNSAGPKVTHFHGKSEEDEGKWIGEKINELVKRDVSYHDIAILYRSNFLSRSIEQTLIHESIDYTIYGGFKFFERMEIKDAIAHLRMVAYEDDLSFLRIINSPRRMIGRKRIAFLKQLAEEKSLTLYAALKEYATHDMLINTGALGFIQLIEEGKKKRHALSVSELLQFLLDGSGYERMIREDGDQDRLDNLQELKHSITQHELLSGEDITLDHY